MAGTRVVVGNRKRIAHIVLNVGALAELALTLT